MKIGIKAVLFCSATVVLLAGCITSSVYPYYTPKDVSFEPALVGTWTNANEVWEVAASGTNAYTMVYSKDKETNHMDGVFFKLHGQGFLDVIGEPDSTDQFPPPIPSHCLLRVVQTKPNLRLAPIDYEWLAAYLGTNSTALRHHVVTKPGSSDEGWLVLTADTAELQNFVSKHLNTVAAWSNVADWYRGPNQH